LVGDIEPSSPGAFSGLRALDISNNDFSGSLPAWTKDILNFRFDGNFTISDTSSSSSGLGGGATAGICIGVTAGVIILVALGVVLWNKVFYPFKLDNRVDKKREFEKYDIFFGYI